MTQSNIQLASGFPQTGGICSGYYKFFWGLHELCNHETPLTGSSSEDTKKLEAETLSRHGLSSSEYVQGEVRLSQATPAIRPTQSQLASRIKYQQNVKNPSTRRLRARHVERHLILTGDLAWNVHTRRAG